jgi:hypothetical protein
LGAVPAPLGPSAAGSFHVEGCGACCSARGAHGAAAAQPQWRPPMAGAA